MIHKWCTEKCVIPVSSVVLVLLDLSAALTQSTILSCCPIWRKCAGIKGKALNWFQSFLENRTFSVNIGDFVSSTASLTSGIPQGSVLAPMLFSIYMLPLGSIFKKYDISFHRYADDSQIYLPLKQHEHCLDALLSCLNDIKAWMDINFLNLNDNKTEIIVFGHNESQKISNFNLGPLSPYVKPCVKNLGVYLDSALKFDIQVSTVVKSSFFHLRALAKVKSFLSFKIFERAIHALITSRLDYCHALYIGITQGSLSRLQMVQNAAARLLTGVQKFEHITPTLMSLHWLPVCYRIDFKVLLMVYKALNGLAHSYLTDLLSECDPGKSLRSSNQGISVVPRTKLICLK